MNNQDNMASLETSSPTIKVPKKSNLAETQERFQNSNYEYVQGPNKDMNKCLNEDQKPQTLELNIRKILNRKIKLSKDF